MRIVVTGATGNIGTSVVEALAAEETVEDIVGVARRRPSWNPPKTTFAATDIRSHDLGTHLRGANVLVQPAWAFQPSHQPLETWDVNVLGSIAAFEAAAEAGVRTIVYASSVGAYSPGPGRRVKENWPTHSMPTAAYGREKAYLERYLDAFELREPQARVVRMRPCFVFKRVAASKQGRIFAGSASAASARPTQGATGFLSVSGSRQYTVTMWRRRCAWPCSTTSAEPSTSLPIR